MLSVFITLLESSMIVRLSNVLITSCCSSSSIGNIFPDFIHSSGCGKSYCYAILNQSSTENCACVKWIMCVSVYYGQQAAGKVRL